MRKTTSRRWRGDGDQNDMHDNEKRQRVKHGSQGGRLASPKGGWRLVSVRSGSDVGGERKFREMRTRIVAGELLGPRRCRNCFYLRSP
eukprot:9176523-Pyramimonas_sp.AAC.1